MNEVGAVLYVAVDSEGNPGPRFAARFARRGRDVASGESTFSTVHIYGVGE